MVPSLKDALADRYEIVRELGTGGMATVYLAEDLRHRRKVAIKVLHPELSAVIGSERFLKEIELTANLQHPHILPLFDSGDANGQLYYVMPFVEGETLRTRLEREQQLPVGDAIRIAREIADALAYAHKRGVVHRDIKPENVLLQDGHALVADFGIALAVQQAGAGRLTQTGLSLGTPQYMSPEQAMGERTIDQRADIYALGAVTYEMIAGEAPFTGPTAQAIIARAMTERPRPLTGMREALPPSVEMAVMTALAKLPADRFSTASEFAEALAREQTVAGPSVSRVPVSSPWRRWLPAAMLLLGAAIGAAIVAGRTPAPSSATDTAPRFFSITVPDSAPIVAPHNLYDEYVRAFDMSSDGRRIAWSSERGGAPILWELRTDLGTAEPLQKTAGDIIPLYSPDATALAFVVPNKGVSKIDLASRTLTAVAARELVEMMAWPGRDHILAADYTGCFGAAPASGGTFAPFPTNPCVLASGGIAAGPDATTLIASNGGAIMLLGARDGAVRWLHKAGTSDTADRTTLVAGNSPFLIDSRTLLFLRDSTLFAARLDPATARLTSEPIPVVSGLRHEAAINGGGITQMAYASSGTFAWISGRDASDSRFVLVSPRSGAVDTLPVAPATVTSYALSTDAQRLAFTTSMPGNVGVVHILDRRRNVIDSTQFPIEVQVTNWVDADSAVSVVFPNVVSETARHYGIVRNIGAHMTLDTSGLEYYASSRDGGMRCSSSGLFWNVAAPRDTIRFDRRGNWCRFSPDGRRITWDDFDGGAFVAPATPAAPAARQRIAPVGANEPRWSADGREVLYRSGNRWYAVPSQSAPNGQLAAPRVVLEGTYNQANASWDLAPDGRLLLLAGTPPRPATHLNVITNFPRYVEAKLSAAH